MSQQVNNKPLLESSALCGHLIRIINDELIDDPRMRINGVLIEDETFRIGFSDLKKLSYRNVVVKYSDADLELQRANQVNNHYWWNRFQKKTKQQMIDTINDIQANRNRQAATANNGNGGGGNANAGDLVASMESVGIGGGGGGGGRAVAGAGNQDLVPATTKLSPTTPATRLSDSSGSVVVIFERYLGAERKDRRALPLPNVTRDQKILDIFRGAYKSDKECGLFEKDGDGESEFVLKCGSAEWRLKGGPIKELTVNNIIQNHASDASELKIEVYLRQPSKETFAEDDIFG